MENNYLIIGPPGSGKTYSAKSKVVEIIRDTELVGLKRAFPSSVINSTSFVGDANDDFALIRKEFGSVVTFVSMHPGYSYSDFVEGVTISSKSGSIHFRNQKKIFLSLIEKMKEKDCAGFIILDDIDRVNISMVFGELLDAIENRNTPYTLMSGESVTIPENLPGGDPDLRIISQSLGNSPLKGINAQICK